MVDSRCAMMICVIRSALLTLRSSDYSVYLSKAEVASSNTIIFGLLTIALAMATLCFWPPDSKLPRDPTILSQFPDYALPSFSSLSSATPKPPFSTKS